MIDERHETLAALKALDLIEGEECRALSEEAAKNPELAKLAQELRETAAWLALTAPAVQPPDGLKDRILASTADEERAPRAAILAFPALLGWAAAACFALASAWLGERYIQARAETSILRDQQALTEVEARSLSTQLETEKLLDQRTQTVVARRISALESRLAAANDIRRLKIAALASVLGHGSQASAIAVWDPEQQRGMLEVSNLPRPAPGKDYQLWVIDPRYPGPVSGGVFHVDPVTCAACVRFQTDRPIRSADRFAVSLERAGGSRSARGPIVLASQ